MLGWRGVGLTATILLAAGVVLGEGLRPSWECVPEDTAVLVRVPNATGFVEEVQARTKFGDSLLRPDRLESLWKYLAARSGDAAGSVSDLEEALEEYGLELGDLLGAGAHDLGGALVVRRREGLPPLAMVLAWAEPGADAAARILEAAKRRIEELQDAGGPGPERIDLSLAGQEVISVVEPVMGVDLRGLDLDRLSAEADEGEDQEALMTRLEELRSKMRQAKPVQTGQTHSYLSVLQGRLLVGSTVQAARPVSEGEIDPDGFEPRCGGDDSRQIFEAFLAAHTGVAEPALARILAEPALAAATLPAGTDLAEVLVVPPTLFAAAEDVEGMQGRLAQIGLDDVGGIVWRHALIDGCWRSTLAATLPTPRHGILSILDQHCDACDVPSFVTSEAVGFTQISLDLGAAFRSLKELLASEPNAEQLANMFMVADVQSQSWLGADVATVLTGLGSRHWVLSFPPRITAALAQARAAAKGGGGAEPVTADSLAVVWAIADEAPFAKLLGRLAPLSGGELEEEQGFRGIRGPNGAAAFVGRGHLVLAMGEGTIEKTLSAIRNPPSGTASLRDSDALRRARELVAMPPARMFGFTDASRTAGTLGMLREFVAGLEPDDVEEAYREILAASQKLLPSAREMEGMFGVGGTVLRMTDEGLVFETAWELPPP